jgi:hypothetical protein
MKWEIERNVGTTTAIHWRPVEFVQQPGNFRIFSDVASAKVTAKTNIG